MTHTPTNFKLHMDRTAIPETVKVAAGSWYMDAARQHLNSALSGQTPIYNPQQGVLGNIQSHLGGIKQRGDRQINEAASWERLQNAADPNRSMRNFMGYLQGKRKPLVSHPIDRFVQGDIRL